MSRNAFRAAIAALCGPWLIAAQDAPHPDVEAPYTGPPADEINYPMPPEWAFVHFRGYELDFEPGDFSYMRGAYPESTAQEQAEWRALSEWLEQCEAVSKFRLRAELAALGIPRFDPAFVAAPYLCRQVPTPKRAFTEVTSHAEIEAALPAARLVYQTLIATSDEAISGFTVRPAGSEPVQAVSSPGLADEIIADALRWELLLNVFEWTEPGYGREPQLGLSPDEVEVLHAMVYSQLVLVETLNVSLLKDTIAEQGWPRISDVGNYAATKAWQIAYNTNNLAFQVEAMRAMEPLLDSGEVEKRDYAMLFDLVHFLTTGKQLYGTLESCVDGRLVTDPVEDAAGLDARRPGMGLQPLAERLDWQLDC
ncbi:DUF6624 domain-containing protein [Erythrobacter aurantius]|uniref:DUF6624 domain-containing protein n=1 Tax=Erythrobacter aurantius TaxID=2909249 RepID=UPI00207ABBEA|nr:DUF6624 domain-containing protein [Erythrobacter aurantius]